MRLIARLIDAGAKPDQIYNDLYENDSLGRLKLIGRTLSRALAAVQGRHALLADGVEAGVMLLHLGHLEEAAREGGLRRRAVGDHREIFVVVEGLVDAGAEQAHEQLLALDACPGFSAAACFIVC